MKKINYLATLLILACVGLLSSCNSSDKIELTHIAVKLGDSERWSIVDVDNGELVCEDEFKNQPSAIVDGIFYVKNENGTYDFYNVDDMRKPINKESFVDVTGFNAHGRALAVKKCGVISIIDKKCNIVKELDKTVKLCRQFYNGLAAFKTSNDLCGYIDEDGNTVIKAVYDDVDDFSDDGIAIVTKEEKNGVKKYEAIDTKGKVLFSFSSSEYDSCLQFNEGMLPVEKDYEVFFLDKTGKKVAKFGEAYPFGVFYYRMRNGMTVFYDGEACGLKDAKGETLFRAKYDMLKQVEDNLFIANKGDKIGLVNKDDEIVLPFEYEIFRYIKKDTYLVGNGKTLSLIDKDGKDISKLNFADVTTACNGCVKSDYFDATGEAKNLFSMFDNNSCKGITANQTLSNFKHLLTYDENYYRRDIGLLDEDGNTIYTFNQPITHETYEYIHGDRFSNGVKFNYNAECIGVFYSNKIQKYDVSAEEQFVKEFEKLLKGVGYKESSYDHFFENKNGYLVGAGYENGEIYVQYYFKTDNIIPIRRIKRDKRKNQEVDDIGEEGVWVDIGEESYPFADFDEEVEDIDEEGVWVDPPMD